MSTLKNLPKVLLQKLLFTILIGIGCFIVGAAYYVFSKDGTTLALSCFVLVFSMIRGAGLYRSISKQKYEIVEGTCIEISTMPFRKHVMVKIMDDAGIESALRFEKQTRLKIGTRYRFYFKQDKHFSLGSEYFDTALSSDDFLGVEELGKFAIEIKSC